MSAVRYNETRLALLAHAELAGHSEHAPEVLGDREMQRWGGGEGAASPSLGFQSQCCWDWGGVVGESLLSCRALRRQLLIPVAPLGHRRWHKWMLDMRDFQ